MKEKNWFGEMVEVDTVSIRFQYDTSTDEKRDRLKKLSELFLTFLRENDFRFAGKEIVTKVEKDHTTSIWTFLYIHSL